MTGKQVVGYIRVSTEGQAVEGVSLEAQQARILAFCQANDYILVTTYIDAGVSGGRADNRPELQHALDTVCELKGALVVYSLSRLARSTKDTIAIAERLDKAGADLVSLSERIDTTSAAGRMIFRMLAVLAEFERDLVSERTCMALAHKRSKGERMGQVPYGYTVDADGLHLIPVEDEQVAARTMRAMRQAGRSYRDIADYMNRQNVPTKEGRQWRPMSVKRVCEFRASVTAPPAPIVPNSDVAGRITFAPVPATATA